MKATAAVALAILAVIGVLYVATLPNAPPAEMTEAEIAQIEAEVRQAISDQWDGFKEAVLAEDYEGWASYWTSDARVLQPGMDLTGEPFFEVARQLFDGGAEFLTLDVEPMEFFVHGDAVYEIVKLDETAILPGGEPIEWHDYLFVRWVKQDDGEWVISHFFDGPRDAPAEG